MYRTLALSVLAALVLVSHTSVASAQALDKESKIKSALSAAPAEIAKNATVVDWNQVVLHEGGNGWVCLPDGGNGPMCLDEAWLNWAHAWITQQKPSVDKVGLAYMLAGGKDASNTDPFATEPAPGEDWIISGPHVMILVPDPSMLDLLPNDPKSGGPYVMFRGTPYAHIMMPVGSD
ncbi:MAG: hypothetical protein JSU87_00950 [Gemmatimonadota bacterium]|nr:MAG: hypothetical protein JSU87_00950 [Gemmatimonadota bacterium]